MGNNQLPEWALKALNIDSQDSKELREIKESKPEPSGNSEQLENKRLTALLVSSELETERLRKEMIPLEQAFRFAEWCSNNKWKYSWAKRLWFNETNPEKGRMNSELFELFNQENNELERD